LRRENIEALKTWDIITEQDEVRFYIQYFTVPKKNGTDRLIGDARPINAAQVKPPKMPIPDMQWIIRSLCRFKFGATIDAVSYFYQFPFKAGTYMAMGINRPRGAPQNYIPLVGPMGWCYMPQIGQKTANSIVAEVLKRMPVASNEVFLVPWLDNFIFAAHRLEDLHMLLRIFRSVCAEVNLELHDVEHSEDFGTVSALGMVFNLAHGTMSLEEKWVTNTRDRIDAATHAQSYRTVAELVGKILWGCYVQSIPLALAPQCIASCRLIAANIAAGASWEDLFPAPKGLLVDELNRLHLFLSQPHKPFDPHITRAVIASSDGYADETCAAWAFVSGDCARSGVIAPVDVFFAELFAATNALFFFAEQQQNVVLHVDNAGLVYALHSICYATCIVLFRMS
jgi:hypothetical protein